MIEVVDHMLRESYVVLIEDAERLVLWRNLAKVEAEGTDVVWRVPKPLGYDEQVRYMKSPRRS
jgi:hypothetical protein